MINLLNINSQERYEIFNDYCKCMYQETKKENNIEKLVNEILDFFGSTDLDYKFLLHMCKMEEYNISVVNKELFNKIIKIINPNNKLKRLDNIINLISNDNIVSSDGYVCICRIILYKMYSENI